MPYECGVDFIYPAWIRTRTKRAKISLSDAPDQGKTKADDVSPFSLAVSLPGGVSFSQFGEAFTTLTPEAKAAHLQGDIE